MAPVQGLDTSDPRAVIEAIRTSPLQRQWLPVARPGHGDLVLMRRHGGASHCGVWIEEGGVVGIAHCARGAGVMLQSEAQLLVQYRDLEYRRPGEAIVKGVSKALQSRSDAALPLAPGEALVVVIHHPEQPLVGADVVSIPPGLAPADILTRYASQIAHAPERCWLFHNGEPLLTRHPQTGEDEWQTRRIGAGDLLFIAPLPPAGGDGSQIFAAVAAIALALAAPYLVAGLGVAALGTTAAGLTLAGQAVAAGIALGGSLLISSLVTPSAPQGPEALEGPSPTYTLTPPGNRLRPGGQIPWICGTMRRQPDLLARPYSLFGDNEQLFHTLLGVGQGRYRINEIGIGDTPVWTPEGLTGALDDVEIEIAEPGERITLFPADVQTNVEVGGQVLPAPEQSASEGEVIGPFVAVAPGTTANRIECDFAFARGLFSLSNDGATNDVTVRWRVEVRRIDEDGTALDDWQAFPPRSVTMGTTTPQRLTLEFPVIEGRYEVRALRETPSTIPAGRGQDELTWVGLKAYIPGDQTFPDVTAIAIKARATETSAQAQRTWYVDATRKLPRLLDGAWVDGATEDIDAALRAVALADEGLNLPPADVDMDTLERLGALWAARGDRCCLVIDTARSAWDVLEAIAATGRAKPQLIGNRLTFMRDEPRPFPVQLITHADIQRGSLEITRIHHTREKPNAIRARYWDRTGTIAEVDCVPPGVATRRWAQLEFPGIVDRDQVFREGVTLAAANNLRRTLISFTMLEAGRSLRMGELIALSHPRPRYGRPSRVVAVDWPRLILSEPHGAEDGASLYLRLSMPDGGHWGPVAVTALADAYTIEIDGEDFALVLSQHEARAYAADPRRWIIPETHLQAPDAEALYASAGRQVEPTRAVLGADAGGAPLEAVVLGMRPRPDGSVEVLCAREDAGVHTAEQGIVPPARPASGLSPQSGAPVWTGARGEVVERGGVTLVKVAGPAIPGAVRYILDLSSDGASWLRAADSASPVLEAEAPGGGAVQLRFAAVGDLRGPWGYQTLDTTVTPYALAAPTAIALIEQPNPAYRFGWQASSEASGWYGSISAAGAVRRIISVPVPYYDYTESLQIEDGGPWREVTLDLQATRGGDASPATLFTATAPPPAALAAPALVQVDETAVTLSCTPSLDPRVRGYRFIVGSDPHNPLAFTDSPTPQATITGLSSGFQYTAAVAAYDAIRSELIWSGFVAFQTADRR